MPSIAASRAPARISSSASKSGGVDQRRQVEAVGVELADEALQPRAALGPGQRPQILGRRRTRCRRVGRRPDIRRASSGRHVLAAEPLLERVEAGRRAAMLVRRPGRRRAPATRRRRTPAAAKASAISGKLPADVVAGAAVEPRLAAGMRRSGRGCRPISTRRQSRRARPSGPRADGRA